MGFWNKEFKYSYSIRLVLAAPKVLPLPYINTTQRYKDTEKNKNSVSLCLCVDIDIRGFILSVAQSVTRERK
jgi:hypothetical protein